MYNTHTHTCYSYVINHRIAELQNIQEEVIQLEDEVQLRLLTE